MSKIINKHICLTPKDFLDMKHEKPDATVFAIWHDKEGGFHKSTVYKWESSHDDDVYLYLSGDES